MLAVGASVYNTFVFGGIFTFSVYYIPSWKDWVVGSAFYSIEKKKRFRNFKIHKGGFGYENKLFLAGKSYCKK